MVDIIKMSPHPSDPFKCGCIIQMPDAQWEVFCKSKHRIAFSIKKQWTVPAQPGVLRFTATLNMPAVQATEKLLTFEKEFMERIDAKKFAEYADRYNPKKSLMYALGKQLTVSNWLELGKWLKMNKEMVVSAGGYFVPKSVSGESELRWVDYVWPEGLE